MFAEGWLVTHIGGRLVNRPAQLGVGHVDTSFGKLLFVGCQVQGRDGLLLADPDARDDRPLDRKRPAEQPAGGMDAPLRQQFPDAAARHALASHFDGGQDVEPESFLASEFSE